MKNNNISLSFEVFPVASKENLVKLSETCAILNNKYTPKFISVTFGAAGSAQLKTLAVVKQLVLQDIPTTPHISCVNMTRQGLQELLDIYIKLEVKRLLVIRGDLVPNSKNSFPEFQYASQLIKCIRELTGNHFHITVAAYPEFHPQALSSETDLTYLKYKQELGANDAITQFFFNSDAYFRFRESCLKLGITIPIIPGIMPIQDYARLVRISNTCGTEIPLWLRKRLDSLDGDVFSIKSLGVELISILCERLLLDEAPGLHFYTLNSVNPTALIYNNLFADREYIDFFNILNYAL